MFITDSRTSRHRYSAIYFPLSKWYWLFPHYKKDVRRIWIHLHTIILLDTHFQMMKLRFIAQGFGCACRHSCSFYTTSYLWKFFFFKSFSWGSSQELCDDLVYLLCGDTYMVGWQTDIWNFTYLFLKLSLDETTKNICGCVLLRHATMHDDIWIFSLMDFMCCAFFDEIIFTHKSLLDTNLSFSLFIGNISQVASNTDLCINSFEVKFHLWCIFQLFDGSFFYFLEQSSYRWLEL